jgi:hypothetical protein
MKPEDLRLLELIKHSASQIGSCLDARDRGYDSYADKHEPLFEAAIEKAIESLPPTLRTTPEFVKWMGSTSRVLYWGDLCDAMDRLTSS